MRPVSKNELIDGMVADIGDDATDQEAAEWLANETMAIVQAVILERDFGICQNMALGLVAIRSIAIDAELTGAVIDLLPEQVI